MADLSSRLFEAATLDEAREILSPIFQRGQDPEGEAVRERVGKIIADVRKEGDRALLHYARELDGYPGDLSDLRVAPEKMRDAFESMAPEIRSALHLAKDRIGQFHGKIRENAFRPLSSAPGTAGVLVRPLRRIGIYVPGGTAAYPSTVLMTAVVAGVAGVPEIVGVTPAGRTGIPPAILAAFHVAGVKEVYQVGGVHSIGALAFGTKTIGRVDKIVGPGNRYVAEAKRQVFGTVDIDMIAGPTEVLIVADNAASPRLLAADLLAQAEHDTQASSVLLVTERSLGRAVVDELERQLTELPRRRIAEEAFGNFGFVLVVPTLERAFEISDLVSPEHLELHLSEPRKWLGSIQNAGAVFVGKEMAEAYGDYCFGPSHVLPTNGSARFSSPVSVETFLKRTTVMEEFASVKEQEEIIRATAVLARLEGLEGHARSALARLESRERGISHGE